MRNRYKVTYFELGKKKVTHFDGVRNIEIKNLTLSFDLPKFEGLDSCASFSLAALVKFEKVKR